MKIEKVNLYLVKLKLKEEFEISSGVSKEVFRILIEILSENLSGWGEVSLPKKPFYSYEYINSSLETLKNFLLPVLKNKKLSDLKDLNKIYKHIKGYNFSKCAIEQALMDLKSKMLGKPLWKLIGGKRDLIKSGVSIGIQKDKFALKDKIEKYLDEGYKRIKVKVSREKSFEYVEYSRLELGYNFELWLDANQDFEIEDIEEVNRFVDLGVVFVEEPFSHLFDYFVLKDKLKVKVCFDERILSLRDLKLVDYLGLDLGRFLNLKMGRVGGWGESLDILRYGYDNGWRVWVGGMLETGIGKMHSLHLCSREEVWGVPDISESQRYWEEDIIEPPLRFFKKGYFKLPEKPGLGVEIKKDLIEKNLVLKLTF